MVEDPIKLLPEEVFAGWRIVQVRNLAAYCFRSLQMVPFVVALPENTHLVGHIVVVAFAAAFEVPASDSVHTAELPAAAFAGVQSVAYSVADLPAAGLVAYTVVVPSVPPVVRSSVVVEAVQQVVVAQALALFAAGEPEIG